MRKNGERGSVIREKKREGERKEKKGALWKRGGREGRRREIRARRRGGRRKGGGRKGKKEGERDERGPRRIL